MNIYDCFGKKLEVGDIVIIGHTNFPLESPTAPEIGVSFKGEPKQVNQYIIKQMEDNRIVLHGHGHSFRCVPRALDLPNNSNKFNNLIKIDPQSFEANKEKIRLMFWNRD